MISLFISNKYYIYCEPHISFSFKMSQNTFSKNSVIPQKKKITKLHRIEHNKYLCIYIWWPINTLVLLNYLSQ